jgi:hypothetical protein
MLVDALRRRLDPRAHSFQLMGEDLLLLDAADLAAAAAEDARLLDRIPVQLRARFSDEQARLRAEAHAFLKKHNRSVRARIAGYVELGRRCRFAYPWPVVAILGIEQVLGGMRQNRIYGLAGALLDRVGFAELAAISDGSDDILRRTNRGIFADSIPTVLYALRVHALRTGGDGELAAALLDGPLPILMDDECRFLARAIANGLARGADRFAVLSQLTLRHFAREQAIFTHHMGASEHETPTRAPRSLLVRRITRLSSVPAPVVVREKNRRRVELRDVPLPPGFDMRDHPARVVELGRAFVESVTRDREDYRAAVAHVLARWGRPGESALAGSLEI